MKRRMACICCGLMLLAASGASAYPGLNLSWNDCGLAGTQNMIFACNTNSGGPFLVYASFDPPAGLSSIVGILAEIYLESASAAMPLWWQFQDPGACRQNSMSVNANFTAGPYSCFDSWAGVATGSFSYTIGTWGSNTARLVVSFSVPEAQAVAVWSDTEHYAFSIAIDRANTVGTDACANCIEPVCFRLYRMFLYPPWGLGAHCIANPRDREFVTWQGGAVASPGCPPIHGPWPSPADCTTPALRNTWGQVKDLYR